MHLLCEDKKFGILFCHKALEFRQFLDARADCLKHSREACVSDTAVIIAIVLYEDEFGSFKRQIPWNLWKTDASSHESLML